MPKAFDRCVSSGGRVRTVSGPSAQFDLNADQYCRVCYDKDGMHKGHKQVKKDKALARAKRVRK